jgi:hypothetical protein
MNIEQWIAKDMEGGGHRLIQDKAFLRTQTVITHGDLYSHQTLYVILGYVD